MNLVDRIADVLHEWRGVALSHAQIRAQMAEDIAEVVHPRIETVEQLDALPEMSIVGLPMGERDHLYAIQKDEGWCGVTAIFEVTRDELAAALAANGPATLLYTPGDAE